MSSGIPEVRNEEMVQLSYCQVLMESPTIPRKMKCRVQLKLASQEQKIVRNREKNEAENEIELGGETEITVN